MANPAFFKPLVVLQLIWKDTGWGTIIFLAALTKIDTGLYEAAAIDGAGPWRRLWHITLPGIRSVIFLLLILRLGRILDTGFEQIFLQRGAVGARAAEVLDTFTYFRGIQGGDWGLLGGGRPPQGGRRRGAGLHRQSGREGVRGRGRLLGAKERQ